MMDQNSSKTIFGDNVNHLPVNKTNVVFFSLTLIGALFLPPIYFYQTGMSWTLVIWAVVYFYLTGMSITVGYHRLFSHKAFEAAPWLRFLLLLFGAGAMQGSCLKWSYDHRRHHRFVDTSEDPYNIHQGFMWAHIGWIIHDDKYANPELPDLSKDKMVLWQHRNIVLISMLMSFVVPMLIGATFGRPLGGLLIIGLLRMVVVEHCTFFINSLCHVWGSRPFSLRQTARDNFVAAWLTFGEGYHNFHHEFSGDYRNAIKWWQWDPTKWFIALCSRFGITWDLRKVPETKILMALVETHKARHPNLKPSFFDKVETFKNKVEEAQRRFQDIKIQFQSAKSDFQNRSQDQFIKLKTDFQNAKMELRASRREFKRACHQILSTVSTSV